ncbi:MAG: hypothetical protein COB67_12345 [SAR324 cluster bacterium]|uniref:IstB-like ATP-binding domain-containing protein n=1 Tax=SAR324 cluster bacterium TaxID=2024889 RepID=A0A2A4SRG0_9DELT|nr:MAG: hypothetical protein COB67_12345 [SAR324 cluster bacterium]
MRGRTTQRRCNNCHDAKIVIIPKGLTSHAEFCSQCYLTCPVCGGDGLIFKQDEMGREFAKRCECQSLIRRMTLFNNAQIPSQFYDSTFENFQVKDNPSLEAALHTAKFAIKNYKKGQSADKDSWKGLLFMGGVGIGKTRLVCTMIRAYTLKFAIPSLFQEFSSLLSEIKAGYDKGLSEAKVLEKINNIEILVIDELGKGRKSEWEIALLDTIISNRYNMKKTTIFTTNYTDQLKTTYQDAINIRGGGDNLKDSDRKETLEQRVYSRIYSRLKGMCNFVEIKAPDYRQPESEIQVNR